MSNRFVLVIIAIAIPVVGFFVTRNNSQKKSPKPEEREFTPIAQPDENAKPEDAVAKPEPTRKRHDQEKFDRFSGIPIDEIIVQLTEELPGEIAISSTDPFWAALPDGPFPFFSEAKPRDEGVLKTVAGSQAGVEGEPSLQDRWRVNVAHVALGSFPDSVPKNVVLSGLSQVRTPLFPVQFAEAGRLDTGPVFAVADFDNDGVEDVIGQGGVMFWKSLKEEPTETGLLPASGLFPADFDGDGDVDLFATRRAGLPNSLWVNDGEGTFVDFTEAAGLLAFADATSAAWGDFNRDGELDLAVGNLDAPLEIYLAAGEGTFDYVTEKWELESVSGVNQLAAADLDNDGQLDLFAGIAAGADRVLRAEVTGLDWENGDSVAAICDFDHDGDLDIFAASRSAEAEKAFVTTLVDDGILAMPFRVFQNDGAGNFTDVTAGLGLPEIAGVTDVALTDLDADGFADLVLAGGGGVPNRAFWNRDGLFFREVTGASRFGFLEKAELIRLTKSGLVLDGLVLKTEIQNPAPRLTMHLETRSAGAAVHVVTRDHDWILRSHHHVASGFEPIRIGLGNAKVIESIEVRWPDSASEPVSYVAKDVGLGAEIAIERGGDAVIVLE